MSSCRAELRLSSSARRRRRPVVIDFHLAHDRRTARMAWRGGGRGGGGGGSLQVDYSTSVIDPLADDAAAVARRQDLRPLRRGGLVVVLVVDDIIAAGCDPSSPTLRDSAGRRRPNAIGYRKSKHPARSTSRRLQEARIDRLLPAASVCQSAYLPATHGRPIHSTLAAVNSRHVGARIRRASTLTHRYGHNI